MFGVGNISQPSAAAATVQPIVGDTEGHYSLLLSENSSGLKLGRYPKDHSDTEKGPVQVNSHLTANVSMQIMGVGRSICQSSAYLSL